MPEWPRLLESLPLGASGWWSVTHRHVTHAIDAIRALQDQRHA